MLGIEPSPLEDQPLLLTTELSSSTLKSALDYSLQFDKRPLLFSVPNTFTEVQDLVT